jgi:hypothetical protein
VLDQALLKVPNRPEEINFEGRVGTFQNFVDVREGTFKYRTLDRQLSL